MERPVMDKSLLDKNVNEIDFTQLDAELELWKINPRFMETFDKLKGKEKVFWLRAYETPSPIEERLVQLVINKHEQVKLSYSEESKVRRAMAEQAAKGIEIETPEQEREWEAKLQNARMLDAKFLQEQKAQQEGMFKGTTVKLEKVEGLSNVKGLADKSIQKLVEAGIRTVDEFHALSYEQKKILVGPIVASKFK